MSLMQYYGQVMIDTPLRLKLVELLKSSDRSVCSTALLKPFLNSEDRGVSQICRILAGENDEVDPPYILEVVSSSCQVSRICELKLYNSIRFLHSNHEYEWPTTHARQIKTFNAIILAICIAMFVVMIATYKIVIPGIVVLVLMGIQHVTHKCYIDFLTRKAISRNIFHQWPYGSMT
jgi:hypothetical protein